eukprot:172019-Chlamydomonas_euryale.AAC.1
MAGCHMMAPRCLSGTGERLRAAATSGGGNIASACGLKRQSTRPIPTLALPKRRVQQGMQCAERLFRPFRPLAHEHSRSACLGA